MGLLGFACEEHTNGDVSSDPTVGVCWDADRSKLWRVAIRPDPRWLSTKAARSEECIGWARELAAGALFLGGAVSELRTVMSRIVRYYDHTTSTKC
jgi:hypothetical protein